MGFESLIRLRNIHGQFMSYCKMILSAPEKKKKKKKKKNNMHDRAISEELLSSQF